MCNQIKIQLERNLKTRLEIEDFLSKKGFFNKNWTEDKCLEATKIVYEEAKRKGVVTDTFTANVFGEDITVALTDGILSTAWGPNKYTLADFGF